MKFEKVLLEEVPGEDRAYSKTVILATFMSWFCCACCLAMTIAGIVFSFEVPAILWVCILPFLLSIWTAYIGIASLCSRRQYIRIYANCIVYRKPFQKTERTIHLHPQDYKIKLHNAAIALGSYPSKFVTELIFLDTNEKKLLSYKAPTLNRSPYQSPRHKWEDDLLSLECEMLDPEEIILNK